MLPYVAARDGTVDIVMTLITFGANTLLENASSLNAAEAALLELQQLDDDDPKAPGLRAVAQLLS